MKPVPEGKVSRNTKSKPEDWKPGGMARIQQGSNVIACSCGWAKVHQRQKVREDAAERHLDKRHQGRGIWL